ncbi:MAG: LssY C-terminal domain-containing protein [bacterium]|nr:LssY C-terminal domain-containing protein [bacterium]
MIKSGKLPLIFICLLAVFGGGCTYRVLNEKLMPPMSVEEINYLLLITTRSDGSLRDPVNIAFLGTKADVVKAMVGSGWEPADPNTLKNVMREVKDIVLHKSYQDAPVSNSFLFGRNEDLAFEIQVQGSPKRRHHVRVWESPIKIQGLPLWAAAATYDRSVEVFPRITHKVDFHIDEERDILVQALENKKLTRGVKYIIGDDPVFLKDCCRFITDGRVALVDLRGVFEQTDSAGL